jgi:hypothetical protein
MFSAKSITKPEDIFLLLSCVRLPGRLTTAESAAVLGFNEHDIATLIAAKLLRPLGSPSPNAPKYFSSAEILTFAGDQEWLSRATKTLSRYWQQKNTRKSKSSCPQPPKNNSQQ